MKKFNVGIQLYGVRNAMAADFEGTLKAVKEMGYDYVEFAGYYGKTSEEIKEILDRLGLTCVSVHQGLDFYNDDAQKGIDYLKGFGVKYSIVPWYQLPTPGTAEWDATVTRFIDIAEKLRRNGMKLGYHNHDFEFTETHEGKTKHDYIIEALGLPLMFPELDTCWVHYAGLRPDQKIRQFHGNVPVVHLKDFVCKNLSSGPVYELIDKDGNSQKTGSKEDNGFEFCPLGRGRQNFAEILAACEECGTETVIVEQDQTYGMDELEAARLSREYLRDTFGL